MGTKHTDPPATPTGERMLTARERECVARVAAGYSAKEIAQQVNIAPRTVEKYLDHARLKLGARNRVHMVAKAIHNGVIDTETIDS